jgi:quercetin dioxygenase-like cupin family protein
LTDAPFSSVDDLATRIDIPQDGTLSLTIHQDAYVKVVLFGFARGQELSEHTASVPAILQQIKGKARWRLGGKQITATPGTWVHMPAQLSHAISAEEPCVMLLTLLTGAKAPASPASQQR